MDIPFPVQPPPAGFSFERNQGQWSHYALYKAKAGDYEAFIAQGKLVLVYADPSGATGENRTAVHMHYVGANPAALVAAEGLQAQRSNYFLGEDPLRWQRNVPHYSQLRVAGVYPGIDLVYSANPEGELKYDFLVKPGVSPDVIRLRFEGATPSIDEEGNLQLQTPLGIVSHGIPVTYQGLQERTPVANRYIIETDGTITFDVGEYDPHQPLVIDPLVYSTLVGGFGQDTGESIAVDADHNTYLLGYTSSSNYPVTAGAFRTSPAAGGDAFVTKFNADGSGLVYSTFLGGAANDYPTSLAIDDAGNAFLLGITDSNDFPTTLGAFQTVKAGLKDQFVAKLNANGNALSYSTYLGGAGDDIGIRIAVDNAGNAYLSGQTSSTDYPTHAAFQPTYGGGQRDALLTKLDPAGSALVASTYLGGTGADDAWGLAVGAGSVYLGGTTHSPAFPTTPGAYRTTPAGSGDIFVTKFDADVSALTYSTFLGGSALDQAHWLGVNAAGEAFVLGRTYSADFPVAGQASQTSYAGDGDLVAMRLDADGSSLAYSTYIGGSSEEWNGGGALLGDNLYLTGFTPSTDYPTSPDAFQQVHGGGDQDAIVTAIGPRGIRYYSTYVGGYDGDHGYELAVDSDGDAYITGDAYSGNFPITSGVFQAVYAGGGDAYVTQVGGIPTPPEAPRLPSTVPGPGHGQVTLSWQVPVGAWSGITQYKVFRSTSAAGPFSLVGTSPSHDLFYTDTGLVDGIDYHYRIVSDSPYGESAPSTIAMGRTTAPPAPPRALTATGGGSTNLLQWRPPVGDGGTPLSAYVIHVSTNGQTFDELDQVTGGATTYEAPACSECLYQVTATNNVGESLPSNTAGLGAEFEAWHPESIRGTTPGIGTGLRDVFPCESRTGSINLASGQFVASTCLLGISSPFGSDVSLVATHRTHQDLHSVLGRGWDLSILRRIDLDGSDALLSDGMGREDRFTWDADSSSFVSPPGFYVRLVPVAGGFDLQHPGGLTEHFDATGRWTSAEDALGHETEVTYDLVGRPMVLADAAGRKLTFQYAGAYLAFINDFAGRTIGLEQDDDGNLEAIHPPANLPGGAHQFTYNARHDLVTAQDPTGQVYLENSYDGLGRVEGQDDGLGNIAVTYESSGETTVVDANGNIVTWSYDPETQVATRKEEATNRDIRENEPESYVTSYLANSQGEIAQVTLPDGQVTQWVYDDANANPLARGNLLSRTQQPSSENPLQWTFAYEPAFQLVRAQTGPKGNDPDYTPPNGGETSPSRFTTTFWYGHDEAIQGDLNNDGQLGWPPAHAVQVVESTVHPDGAPDPGLSGGQVRTSSLQYNDRGQVTQSVNADGSYLTYDYYEPGELGFGRQPFRLQRVERHADFLPGGGAFSPGESLIMAGDASMAAMMSSGNPLVEDYQYDLAGNLVEATDPRGHATTWAYDELGRVTQVARVLSATGTGSLSRLATNYTYDGNGNTLTVSRENAVQQPDGSFRQDTTAPVSTDRFEYDVRGHVTATTLAADRPAGAPASTQPTELREQFTYDPNGNLLIHRRHGAVTGEDPSDLTTYAYNERNQGVVTTVGGYGPLFSSLNSGLDLSGIDHPLSLYLHASVSQVGSCPANSSLNESSACASAPSSACPGGSSSSLGGRVVCRPPPRYPLADVGLQPVATLPSPRMGAAMAWDAAGGKAYVLGGSASTVTDQIIAYDPETRVASVVARLPSPRWLGAAVFDGEHVYHFGGCTVPACGVSTDEIVRFDPLTNEVTVVGHLPTKLNGHAAVWDGSRAYVFGGCSDPCNQKMDILSFDPATGEVTLLPSTLPKANLRMPAVWTGEKVLLFGGTGPDSSAIVSFDPATGVAARSPTGLPRALSESAAAWDGRFAYVFGGLHTDGSTSSAILRYDPVDGELVTMAQGLTQPTRRMATAWTTDSALVVGGYGGGHLSRIEQYKPVVAAPTEPQGLLAVPGPAPGETTLRWQAPNSTGSTSLVAYHVYESDQPGGPYTPAGTAPAPQRHLVVTAGAVGETTYYVVTAENGDLEGPASLEANVVNTPVVVESPITLCSGEQGGVVVADRGLCQGTTSCPPGTVGGVAPATATSPATPACVAVFGCPAGSVGILANDRPACAPVPSVCLPTASCPEPGDVVCYLPEPCLHVVQGILAAHMGPDGIGLQVDLPDLGIADPGPVVVFVPLGGLPYHPGLPIVDLDPKPPEEPEEPDPDPSWLWAFHMDDTAPAAESVMAMPASDTLPARMSWEWSPSGGYDFTGDRVQLVFWAAQSGNATATPAWHARLYSDEQLVASTDPYKGKAFIAPLGSAPREYRIDLGTPPLAGSALRLDLDLGAMPEGRLVLFDSAGMPSRLEIGTPTTTTTDFDDGGRPLVSTDAMGAQTLYGYDHVGRQVSVTDAAGRRQATYDPEGLVTESSTYGLPDGSATAEVLLARTRSSYDEAGRLYRLDQAFFDLLTGQPLPDGALAPGDGMVTTLYDHDAAGRRTKVIDDNGDESLFTYDGLGNLIETQDALGNRLVSEYDDAGNLIRQTRYDLDANGVELPGRRTLFAYDDLNRVRLSIDSANRVQRFGYDARGNLAWQTDAQTTTAAFLSIGEPFFSQYANGDGNRVNYLYDSQSRLISTEHVMRTNGLPPGAVLPSVTTTQDWDGNGRLVRQTDAGGKATTYEYDNHGRLVRTAFADGTWEDRTYDARGNLIRTEDAEGNVVHQAFDEAGQLVSRTATGPTAHSTRQGFDYDGLGRLTLATDNNDPDDAQSASEVALAYDSLGRAIRETQDGVVVERSFDGVGNQVSLTYGNGRTVDATYDALRRLTALSDDTGTLASFRMDGRGWFVERTAGNGVRSTYTYTENPGTGSPSNFGGTSSSSLVHALPGLARPFRYDTGFDRAGNPTLQLLYHAPELSVRATYDSLDRIVAFQRANWNSLPAATNPLVNPLPKSSTWTLDGTNEWDATSSVIGTSTIAQTRTHGDTHAVTAITIAGTSTPYVSDDAGNRVADGSHTYEWDAFDRLRVVKDKATGAVQATYDYDALGRRVAKTVAGEGTTRFVYAGDRVIEERDGEGDLLRQFVHGDVGDQPLALDRNLDGDSSATGTGDQRLYYLQDALGSVAGLMDKDDTLIEGYVYDSYGKALVLQAGPSGKVLWTAVDVKASKSAVGNPYMFTGQRFDPESGLHHYRARYYDAYTGSFLSRDPIGVWGDPFNLGNGYAYVGNQPLKFTDPTGQCVILCGAIIGAAAGAIVGIAAYSIHAAVTDDEWDLEEAGEAVQRGLINGAVVGAAFTGAPMLGTAVESALGMVGLAIAGPATEHQSDGSPHDAAGQYGGTGVGGLPAGHFLGAGMVGILNGFSDFVSTGHRFDLSVCLFICADVGLGLSSRGPSVSAEFGAGLGVWVEHKTGREKSGSCSGEYIASDWTNDFHPYVADAEVSIDQRNRYLAGADANAGRSTTTTAWGTGGLKATAGCQLSPASPLLDLVELLITGQIGK